MPDEPLRLLLVMGPSTGGIGRHVLTLAGELSRRAHDVVVCAPAASSDTFDWAGAGARFVAVPVGVQRPVDAVRAHRGLHRAAADRDVVHAHGSRGGAAAALAGLHPLVVTWHNAPIGSRRRQRVHAALERVAARRAEVTLGASEDLAARARAAGGRDVRFAPVTAPPLAPATRDRSAVRADLGVGDRPLVLVVARLAAQKRLDLLVRATRGWLDDPTGPMVVVAGDGRLRDEVRAAAAAHRSSVVLLGHRNDVADLLQAADLLALPSDWEARPLVVQEALRAGVPVVATDVGGVAGLVGEAGLLVPAGDVEALRSAMQRLLGDPAERQRLASLGRARAATWPTVEDMVDDLEALYLDLRSRFSRRSRQ